MGYLNIRGAANLTVSELKIRMKWSRFEPWLG